MSDSPNQTNPADSDEEMGDPRDPRNQQTPTAPEESSRGGLLTALTKRLNNMGLSPRSDASQEQDDSEEHDDWDEFPPVSDDYSDDGDEDAKMGTVVQGGQEPDEEMDDQPRQAPPTRVFKTGLRFGLLRRTKGKGSNPRHRSGEFTVDGRRLSSGKFVLNLSPDDRRGRFSREDLANLAERRRDRKERQKQNGTGRGRTSRGRRSSKPNA